MKCKDCLIIRSAGEKILLEALEAASPLFASIDILSNRNFEGPRPRQINPGMNVSGKNVTYTGDLADHYQTVIILLDIKQYSLSSYRKFIRFARKNWKCNILYYSREKRLTGLWPVLRFLAKRKLYRGAGYCLYSSLAWLRPLKKIVLCEIRTDRIGHLAANNDAFLRKTYLGKDKTRYIGFVGLAKSRFFIANRQLFKMLKRKMTIVKSTFLYRVVHESKLLNSPFYLNLTASFKSTECEEFDNAPVNLQFTKKEEKRGRRLLKEMGIESWYVCFHARDNLYLKQNQPEIDCGYHDYRDCDIENFYPAMEYIAQLGGCAVRMGSIVEKPLETRGNPRIIDYATQFRSDFMDIYLSATCKFFVGNTAGLMLVPTIFNVPLVSTNYIPASYSGVSKREIVLPKKIWDNKQERYLTFEEIFSRGIDRYLYSEQYREQALKPVENSPDEIKAAAEEMNLRIDGKLQYSEEDEQLQERYRAIFKAKSNYYYEYTSRIGNHFLHTNKDMLQKGRTTAINDQGE